MLKSKQKKLVEDVKPQKKILGRRVRYVGCGVKAICPNCDKVTINGMVSEYEGLLYCSSACVEKHVQY